LSKYRYLEAVVGIGVDAPTSVTEREGGSEDLVAVGRQEWTPEFAAEVEQRRAELNILETDLSSAARIWVDEYPASPEDAQPTTRQQRRALERAHRKRLRKLIRQKPFAR
jgi:hypothetical protein